MLKPAPCLTFAQLRDANVKRIPTFRNAKGVPYHKPDGSGWTLGEWINALGGEVGETANIIKKIQRGDCRLPDVVRDIMDEVADIQTYLDIVAYRFGLVIFEGKSFNDLRAATIKRYHSAKRTRHGSIGEMSSRLMRWAGDLSFIADQIRDNDNSRHPIRKDSVESRVLKYIHSMQLELDFVAYACGIDLGKATAIKFNTVSVRVGSPIFIDLADMGRPIKCVSCGHVFKFDRSTASPHLMYEGSHWAQRCPKCNELAKLMMVPGEPYEIAKGFK